jgi:C1A family cysteine protease
MSNGKIQLSRLQLYFCARGFEKLSLTEDTGLNLLGTLQTIKLYGLTDEENWPYVITNFANLAPAPSFTQLYTLNNYSYANVIQDLAHIKECLILNIPILIGVSVYNSFESTTANSTGVIPMPSSNESLLGGHCIVLVGYDDNSGYFKFQNSWGKKWGDKGYGYLPYNYVTDSTLTHDLYVVHFT